MAKMIADKGQAKEPAVLRRNRAENPTENLS
jgi:hypothetical protein